MGNGTKDFAQDVGAVVAGLVVFHTISAFIRYCSGMYDQEKLEAPAAPVAPVTKAS